MQEDYRAESAQISRLWTLWLPLVSLGAILATAKLAPAFYRDVVQQEGFGILELAHVALPLAVAALALLALRTAYIRLDPLRVAWCVLLALGAIYWAGEEASWGQHFFGWSTPDGWVGVNDQQETNLHNTSHLLDQLPRAILRIGIIVAGLIGPWLILHRPRWQPQRFLFAAVPLAGVPLAALVLAMEPLFVFKQGFENLFDTTVVGVRVGEIDELYVAWYLVLYALVLYRRAMGTSPFARHADRRERIAA